MTRAQREWPEERAQSRLSDDVFNPYLAEAEATHFGEGASRKEQRGDGWYQVRWRLVSMYSWAIPDDSALGILARYAPIIEIGAGTGYWAWLLRKWGVDILAFDHCPPTHRGHANQHHNNPDAIGLCWTDVQLGGPEQLPRYPERTLFLCWPPYDTPMASECLRLYSGDTLIYVGEVEGGVTGDPDFHRQLAREWTPQLTHHIPTWDTMRDRLVVYKRRKQSRKSR